MLVASIRIRLWYFGARALADPSILSQVTDMKFIRWLLGKLILILDRLFSPAPIKRSAEEQQKVDAALAGLSLYEFQACPFCVKVRRFLRASGASLPLRDAKSDPWRSELMAGGGKLQVPCLKLETPEGSVKWMYESNEIISFLRDRIALK